jgi:CYTH domain-containing protein
MNQEIERKFLLKSLPPHFEENDGFLIEQGYLAIEPHGTQVRLRKKGKTAYLTCKRGGGTVREEYEVELSAAQFDALWPLTAGRRLVKRRHEVPYQGHVVEIDIYNGSNRGLIVAEVEFESEDAARDFVPPDWFAKDVSGSPKYSNRNLARE